MVKHLQLTNNDTDLFSLNAANGILQSGHEYLNKTKLYYDITDLVGWNINHLSGIQRVSVGILNALVGKNMNVDIVAYNHRLDEFYSVNTDALSPNILKYFSFRTREVIAQNHKELQFNAYQKDDDVQSYSQLNQQRLGFVF